MLRFCTLLLLLSCSALAACTGQPALAPLAPAAPAPTAPPGRLPGFPTQAQRLSAVRQASASSVSVDGDGFVAQSGGGNYSPGGGTYIIIPGSEDELAWAQYDIGGLTDGKPVKLSLSAAAAAPQGGGAPLPLEYWLGVANYTTYRWEWSGPHTGSTSVELNSLELRDRYISASGTMSYVVFVLPGAAATPENPQGLNGLALRSSTTQTPATYQANKPHYTLTDPPAAGDGKSGSAARRASVLQSSQYVTLRWEHVTAFNLPDTINEAFQYQVFRQGPLDTLPVNIGSVLAPEVAYVDPLDNASSAVDPIPGATYTYFLRAVNPTGFTPLAPMGSITIPLLAPTNLAASDGVFPDKVRLVWTRAQGASKYLIYRDGLEIAEVVGSHNTYFDESLIDTNPHSYALRSANPFGVSELTPGDMGNLQATVQHDDLEIGTILLGPTILMVDAAFNPATNLPVASFTCDSSNLLHGNNTHLYEYVDQVGWQESTPAAIAHGDLLGAGSPCTLAFAANGDLAFGFGSDQPPSASTRFGLRLGGQGTIDTEQLDINSFSHPVRTVYDAVNNRFGVAYAIDDNVPATPNYIGLRLGTLGSMTAAPSTPTLADPQQRWNYDLCFDAAGDPHIAYCDGRGGNLNLWYLIAGSWQTITLDNTQCYGVSLAAGPALPNAPAGLVYVLYQRPGELRLALGGVNRQTGEPLFVNERVLLGGFVGFLERYTTDIAVDSQGQPHIVYPTDALGDGGERLYYRYRDAQGWQDAVLLDRVDDGSTFIEARHCALALDANDRPFVAYAHTPHHLKSIWYR